MSLHISAPSLHPCLRSPHPLRPAVQPWHRSFQVNSWGREKVVEHNFHLTKSRLTTRAVVRRAGKIKIEETIEDRLAALARENDIGVNTLRYIFLRLLARDKPLSAAGSVAHQADALDELAARLSLFRRMGVDTENIVRGLQGIIGGTKRRPWAWRPLEELESFLEAWKAADAEAILLAQPVKLLRVGTAHAGDNVTLALEGVLSLRELGLNDREIIKIIRHNSSVLQAGTDVLRQMWAVQEVLGFETKDMLHLVRRWGSVLRVPTDKAQKALDTLKDLGIPPEDCRTIVRKCPSLLGNRADLKLLPSFLFFFEIGMSKELVRNLTVQSPTVLTMNLMGEQFHQKIELLRHVGITSEDIGMTPKLLTYSLDRMGPRCMLLARAQRGQLPQLWELCERRTMRSVLAQVLILHDADVTKLAGMSDEEWTIVKEQGEVIRGAQHHASRWTREYATLAEQWKASYKPPVNGETEQQLRDLERKWEMVKNMADKDKVVVDDSTGEWRTIQHRD